MNHNLQIISFITVIYTLHTMMDSERVMDLKDGRVREFDKPLTVIKKDPDGVCLEVMMRV